MRDVSQDDCDDPLLLLYFQAEIEKDCDIEILSTGPCPIDPMRPSSLVICLPWIIAELFVESLRIPGNLLVLPGLA